MTGLYADHTGAGTGLSPLFDNVTTFAQILKSKGYLTAYAGKWHLDGKKSPEWEPSRKFGWIDNKLMFNSGHWKKIVPAHRSMKLPNQTESDLYYDADGNLITNASKIPKFPNHVISKHWEVWRGPEAAQTADETNYGTDFLTDRAIDFLTEYSRFNQENIRRNNRKRPFLYMLSIPDPHPAYSVRYPYNETYDATLLSSSIKYEAPPNYDKAIASSSGKKFSPRLLSQYLGMVDCLDYNIGRIITTLRQENLLETTLIIFTSDHGDLLFEHGRIGKMKHFDMSVRIPFIVRIPASLQAMMSQQKQTAASLPSTASSSASNKAKTPFLRPGSVVKKPFATVDFKATLLGLLGVLHANDNGSDDETLGSNHGIDVSSYFQVKVDDDDDKGDPSFDQMITSSSGFDASNVVFCSLKTQYDLDSFIGAFDQRYKLTIFKPKKDGEVQFILFDLQEDPLELMNYYNNSSYCGEIRRLALALQTHIQDRVINSDVRKYAIPGIAKILQECDGK